MITPGNFTACFEELTGNAPFPWQERLAQLLCSGITPGTVAVPTGMGKTSVVLAWAFALATQLSHEPGHGAKRLPLRLFYVVDRRIIVDAAFDAADHLRRSLESPPPGSVLAEVANALKNFAGPETEPLKVVRMRGGVTWDARWVDAPHQPAVVVGTVDQFGSRLLFRGYGVTPTMAPIDAALCGVDAWVVIDEAHISAPLVETLQHVLTLQSAGSGTAFRPTRVTLMSATSSASFAGPVLAANLASETSAQSPAAQVARQRLSVSKPAQLKTVTARGKGSARLQDLGARLGAEGSKVTRQAGRYAVLCNTVQAARAAHQALLGEGAAGALLLTGRVREFERELLVSDVSARFGSSAPRPTDAQLLVATQTVEVGADLDFDAVVTECAPLASLIQRFGRVRRMGHANGSTSVIVYCEEAHKDDPVYGGATAATWELLRQVANSGNTVDFSWPGIENMLRSAPATTRVSSDFVPVLLGAHVERWAQTSPVPMPDQAVAPFLHGFQAGGPPQVFIAWRAIPRPESGDDTPEHWQRWLELAPLASWEMVAVPLHEARAFIAGTVADSVDSDVELASVETPPTDRPNREQLARAVVLGEPTELPRVVHSPEDIQAYCTVVVDARMGGHDRWGWNGTRADPAADAPVPDVGDLVPSRRGRSLRLAPSIAATHAPGATGLIYAAWERFDPEDPQETLPGVLEAFAQLVPDPLADPYRTAAAGLRDGTWTAYLPERDAETGQWLTHDAGRPVVRLAARADRFELRTEVTDDDALSTSLSARARVPLMVHGDGVGRLARDYAEKLGLPAELARAVELAGRLHDIGKAEPRFQAALYDGDTFAAMGGVLLAKSGRDPRDQVARQAHRLAGLPRGFRHEAVSGRLVRALASARPELFQDLDLDLVHHLVVAHHGHGRPLLPPVAESAPPPVTLEVEGVLLEIPGEPHQVDWSHPQLFQRLNERYGWWGLAFLEAIVRLADMKASELGAAATAAWHAPAASPGRFPPQSTAEVGHARD